MSSAAIETAVILAAGMGTRLASRWDAPKGFLRLGERPIIEESLERLRAVGVRRVIIVTGYGAEHYEGLAARYGGLVRTAHNPAFADHGSMASLRCAAGLLAPDERFLLLESDLIYERRGLTALLEHPAASGLLLSGPTGAGDEVYVEVQAGRAIALSKRRAELGAVGGELVGITKVAPELWAAMLAHAAARLRDEPGMAYETGALAAVAHSVPIAAVLVPDLRWGEIDDPSQLRRAREQVYPAIIAAERSAP